MDEIEPQQKRKRCDSDSNSTGNTGHEDDGLVGSITKKRPTLNVIEPAETPQSPIQLNVDEPSESPASPSSNNKSPVSPDITPRIVEPLKSPLITEDDRLIVDVIEPSKTPQSPTPLNVVEPSESPASPSCNTNKSAASPAIVEPPKSPPIIESPASPPKTDSSAIELASFDEGEIIDDDDDDDTEDCQIMEKPIPLIVVDADADDSNAVVDVDDAGQVTVDISIQPKIEKASFPPADPTPLMCITFRDAATADRLHTAVQQAIRQAMFRHQLVVDLTPLDAKHSINVCESAHIALIDDDNFDGVGRGIASADCVFIVDSAPSANHRRQSGAADDVPQYRVNVSRVYDPTKLLHSSADAAADGEPAPARAKSHCFNCDGDHQMRDCTEPRNANKIRENRMQFNGGVGRVERYHVDANQKFGHFMAGELSAELRTALGLSAGDLPMHVYRMRQLGYPPGWLESARVSRSGLALFDEQGADGRAPPAAGGEERDAVVDNDEYDLKKIVSFPGFNVEPPEGTFDFAYNLRMPQMQAHQSRDTMLSHLRAKSTKSYKRQQHITNIPVADVDTTAVDLTNPTMEIDADDNPPMPSAQSAPQQPPPPPPPTSPPPAPPSSDTPSTSTPEAKPRTWSRSPTLDDLRQRQDQLLAALDDSVQSLQTVSNAMLEESNVDDSLIDDIMELDRLQQSTTLDNTQCDEDIKSEPTSPTPPTPPSSEAAVFAAASPSVCGTPLNTSSKRSMSGTPLLQTSSPYSQLPAGSNWSVGVSDIIDFENLSDATGKYERMKGLIKRVRVTVKELNDVYDG